MALVFYCRVSTRDQNLDRQLKRAEEVHADKVFADKYSGKSLDRPEFEKMMDFLREGDTLEVASLDRLSRNYTDLKKLIEKLRKMDVKLVADDLPQMHSGNELIDNFLMDMLVGLMGFVAQNEREKLHERQMQGIAIAKAKGKYKGGTVKYSPDSKHPQNVIIWRNVVCMLKSKQYTISEIAKENGISRMQVYRIKNRLPRYKEEASKIKA